MKKKTTIQTRSVSAICIVLVCCKYRLATQFSSSHASHLECVHFRMKTKRKTLRPATKKRHRTMTRTTRVRPSNEAPNESTRTKRTMPTEHRSRAVPGDGTIEEYFRILSLHVVMRALQYLSLVMCFFYHSGSILPHPPIALLLLVR